MGYKYFGNDESLRNECEKIGWKYEMTKANNNGIIRIETKNGTIFNKYKTGTISVQGKQNAEDIEILEKIIKDSDVTTTTIIVKDKKKHKIYIVHGHDENSKNELENILMRWGLETIISQDRPPAGKTIIEGVIDDIKECDYGIILLTPDDYGYAVKEGDNPNPKPRARQNVIMEMGMVISALGRDKVTILRKNEIEQPSDTDGLIYISFAGSIKNSNAYEKLRKNLLNANIKLKE